jgi:hypothetical protein
LYAMYILRQTTRKGTLALSEIYARQLETKYIIYSYQRSKNRISNPQFSKDRKIRGPNLTHVIRLIADSTSAFNVPFADADERCIILVADTDLRHRVSIYFPLPIIILISPSELPGENLVGSSNKREKRTRIVCGGLGLHAREADVLSGIVASV